MKTVLLVNPSIHDFAAYDLWMKPWGLLKISSILKNSDWRVYLADAMDRHHVLLPGKVTDKADGTGKFISEEIVKPPVLKGVPRRYKRYGLSPEILEKSLPEENIDVVLVSSGMTYWYPGVFEAIGLIKKKYKKVPVVLGGTYATLCHDHAVKNSGADHVIRNGEHDRLSGLMGGGIDFSFRNILEADIDISFYAKNPYAVLRISLGCPFDCSYCAQKYLSPPFILKSLDRAVMELKKLYEKGIRNFAFYDDALLFEKDHIEEYLKRIEDEGIKAGFYLPNGLHARFLTDKTAFLLRKNNFKDPILSLETAVDEKGRLWHDKVTRKEFTEAVLKLNSSGYRRGEYTAYLMLGVPGSRFDDVKESMDFAHSLGCRISLSEFSPVPGTFMGDAGKTGNEDPLLGNNSVFSFFSPGRNEGARELKDMANILNSKLKQR